MAIPYVLSECHFGQVEIDSRCEHHIIEITIDRIAQRPDIKHAKNDSVVKNGTRVKVLWPDSAKLTNRYLNLSFFTIAYGLLAF